MTFKKTAHAAERERADVAEQRKTWLDAIPARVTTSPTIKSLADLIRPLPQGLA